MDQLVFLLLILEVIKGLASIHFEDVQVRQAVDGPVNPAWLCANQHANSIEIVLSGVHHLGPVKGHFDREGLLLPFLER